MGFRVKMRRAEAEAKAKAKDEADEVKVKVKERMAPTEAQMKAREEAEARARARAKARAVARAEAEARADAEKEAKKEAKAKAKAQAEAEAEAKDKAEAKDNADEAKGKERMPQPEAQMKAKAEVEQKSPPVGRSIKDRDYLSPEQVIQFRRFHDRLEECGPFDVDYFPDNRICGMLCSAEKDVKNVEKCVRRAIEFAKKEKRIDLEDPKVVRANQEIDEGFVYYITFDAKDKKSGMRQLYEAKVWLTFAEVFKQKGHSHVRLIRVKNPQKRKNKGY